MGELAPQYSAEIDDCNWDAMIRAHTVAKIVIPINGGVCLELPPRSYDELIEILKHRDRVRVVEIEVERGPRFLDAVFWGFGLWAFFDFAAAFVRGLLS